MDFTCSHFSFFLFCCPEKLFIPAPWKYSRLLWMGLWVGVVAGSPAHGKGLELSGLKDPFQTKSFY